MMRWRLRESHSSRASALHVALFILHLLHLLILLVLFLLFLLLHLLHLLILLPLLFLPCPVMDGALLMSALHPAAAPIQRRRPPEPLPKPSTPSNSFRNNRQYHSSPQLTLAVPHDPFHPSPASPSPPSTQRTLSAPLLTRSTSMGRITTTPTSTLLRARPAMLLRANRIGECL
jgi:hypothetical protein